LPACVITEDAKWASELLSVLANGEKQVTADPTETLCLKCSLAVDAYPEYEQGEVVDKVHNDRKFGGDFKVVVAVAESIAKGDADAPKFVPRIVENHLTMERTFKVRVGYIAQDFLEAKFEISLSASRIRTCDAYNLNGQRYPAVAMALNEIPADWPFLPGSIKFKESCFFAERSLQAKDQLRDPQAMAAFYKNMGSMSLGKCDDVKIDSVGNLQSQKTITDKFKRALCLRNERSAGVEAEMNALVGGNDFVVQPIRVNHRRISGQGEEAQRGAVTGVIAAGTPRNIASASATRGRSRTRGAPPATHNTTDSKPRRVKSAKHAGHSGGSVGAASASAKSRSASGGHLVTPPSARKAPEPISDKSVGPKVGGYYKHKEFDYFEILQGAAPTRQTAPATWGRLRVLHMFL
jgi:hypothetical protein